MKRTREDNTVAVVQRAVKEFGIQVTKSSVKLALKSHPNYPTLKSICDVLNEWKIEHYPLKCEPEEIADITVPYIAHFNVGGGRLGFVSDYSNTKITYFDSYTKKIKADIDGFTEKCSGAVILLNPGKGSGEKDYKSKWQQEMITSSILPASIFTVILLIIVLAGMVFTTGSTLAGLTPVFLIFTKLFGLTFSTLLVLHDYEIRLSLTDKLCHLNKATNCNTVLNDKASKVFGWIGWSDIGFVYFLGSLLVLFNSIRIGNFTIPVVLSVLSVPYPVFSVYYQGSVLKKWCPLCLGVQLVLIMDFILLIPRLRNLYLSFESAVFPILSFLVIGIIYISINLYFREKMLAETNYLKYLGFKKNKNVLNALLSGQKRYDIPVTESSLVFGIKDSPFNITAFLSLHCSYCASAFQSIRKALNSNLNAEFNIILVTSDTEILNTLYSLNRSNKEDEALNLLDQWYSMDPYSRHKIHDTLCLPDVEDIAEGVNNENMRLFKECNVPGTPTFFVNGYRLPNQYTIDDIKYFPEVFIESREVKV